MDLEAKKYLSDIAKSAGLIESFTDRKNLADYESDAMLRSAVERQFEIIGEALVHLAQIDSAAAARISLYRRIIAFRNILIHGYTDVDDRIVWDVVKSNLPVLRDDVTVLLRED